MTNCYVKESLKGMDLKGSDFGEGYERSVIENGFIAYLCWVPYHACVSGCLLLYTYPHYHM